jgi:hypothetical protein
LAHPSDRVIDVPHLANYEGFMDVYLSGRANLVVAMPSGPEALAHVQGRPCVMVNELPAQKGDYIEDATLQARYQQLGAGYEADTQPQHGAYSVAHEGWGRLCQSTLPSN